MLSQRIRSVCRVAGEARMRPLLFQFHKNDVLDAIFTCFSNKFSSVDKHVRHLLRDVQSLAASYIHTSTRSSKTRGRWQRCEMWPSSSVCNCFSSSQPREYCTLVRVFLFRARNKQACYCSTAVSLYRCNTVHKMMDRPLMVAMEDTWILCFA
jgi:hypothetical protein